MLTMIQRITSRETSQETDPSSFNPLLISNHPNDAEISPPKTQEMSETRKTTRRVTGIVALFIMVYFIANTFLDQTINPGERKYKSLLATMGRRGVCNKSSDLQFVGFWHIGASNQPTIYTRDEFVKKQLKEIQSTHLFKRCNNYNVKLNYVTRIELSPQIKKLLSRDERVQELPPTNIENMNDDEEYFEFTTLMEMYSYCKNLPEDDDPVVFYIHSKSKHLWRLWMENYLMGEECTECLSDSTKMACGPSLIKDTDYIWQHFSGNFFMTRCQHIRQLNPPYTDQIMDETRTILRVSGDIASGFPHSYPPYGRYAAEYWLMNDAGERPAHMYDAERWPQLKNKDEGHHNALIKTENTCTMHPPHEIVSSEY